MSWPGWVPEVSFTDCMVMVVADHYGTKDIFGFDMQFVDAGYNRLVGRENSRKAKRT
jgi:predicted nucleic acid-binding protein